MGKKYKPADGWQFGRDPNKLGSQKSYKRGLKAWDQATRDFETIGPTQKKYYDKSAKGIPFGSINPPKRRKKR